MPVYYPGCDTDELPDYQCDPCDDYEKGRVRSVAFVSTSYYSTLIANPTSVPVWQSGILSGDIVVIAKVIGSLDAPDPITGPGYGDDVETVLGRDYTLNWRDPSYKNNCTFYNTLKRKSFYAIYRTGSQTHISDKVATIDTKAPVTENLEDNVEWNGSAKWRSQDNPCPFNTPANIFECFAIS